MKTTYSVVIALLVACSLSSVMLTTSPNVASVASAASSSLTLNPSSCQVKFADTDSFSCPCSGGSGNYVYTYTELPDGWQVNNDQIWAPKGSLRENHVYGCKVQVNDKKSKQSVKKSLFFTVKGGKISSIVDYLWNFNIDNFITFTTQGSTSGSSGSSGSSSNTNTNLNNIKNIFDGVFGIGGGCGLLKLRPYLLGTGGLYKGDSSNPYLKALPTDAQITTLFASGNSSDIITFIVNVARSRVGCKGVTTFLNSFLQQVRTKMIDFNTQVNTTTQLIVTIQAQIDTLTTQLTTASGSLVDINALKAQLADLQNSLTTTQNSQSNLKTELTQVTANSVDYQSQIATLVGSQK
jgi:FtsZ-binding cell division protein ZapB